MKYLEKFKEDWKQFKRNIVKLSKICTNSGKKIEKFNNILQKLLHDHSFVINPVF